MALAVVQAHTMKAKLPLLPLLQPWQSRSTFVLALAAAAVGLGNIWRFAYLLGEHGGAPFMLAYVASLLLIAVPIMVAEVVIGNLGRGSPWVSVRRTARKAQRSELWALLAPLVCTTALILLVASAVIAAWSLVYAYHHQLGSFAAISLNGTRDFFEDLLTQPLQIVGWLTLALLPLLAASAAGAHRGVVALMWLCIPVLIVLFGVLIDFAVIHGDLAAAGDFLFRNQLIDFSGESVLLAFSHALFTLGIGMAVGMTFGAYASERLPLCRSVMAVGLFDVVVAVAVSVAIYPLLFASNLQPAQGFGLLFIALPYSFGNISLGDFFGTLFFFAVYVVSLASAVALTEPLISQLEQLRVKRWHAALATVGAVWLMAMVSFYSLVPESLVYGLFVSLEKFASLFLVPLAALLLSVYVGWRLPIATVREALEREPDILFTLWYFLLRFVVPPAVFLAWLGVIRTAH